jgi:hypothetical protein
MATRVIRAVTIVLACFWFVLGLSAPVYAATGWRCPLDGTPTVVRAFDPPATPYGRGHRGVDLAAAVGSVVHAAGQGVVSYAGVLAGRGVVTVRHQQGLRTTYEPLRVTVRVGQPVAAGAELGLLAGGHPGCPTDACLHWGLIDGRTYLDPLTLLGGGQVRLLPLDSPTSDAPITTTGLGILAAAGLARPRWRDRLTHVDVPAGTPPAAVPP